jgi:membrane protein DedA with SNARE-associated domain
MLHDGAPNAFIAPFAYWNRMSLVEWGTNLILDWISNSGYLGIIMLMTLESACIPVPSEIVMPFAGYLVFQGQQPGFEGAHLTLLGITIAGAIGCTIGSIAAYAVGVYAGRPFVLKYGKYFLVREKHLLMAEKWFAKYGDAATFISRLLPVVRTVISLPAGIAKMDFKKFVFYCFMGSLPWTFMLGYVGYWLGPNWDDIVAVFRQLDIVVVVAVIALVAWYLVKLRNSGAGSKQDHP